MAKKVLTHKRHVDGLEAPRNSLELPVETSCTFRREEHTTCPYQVAYNYPIEAPIKKLISDEISKRPTGTKQNTPSVVARLMGVDMLPPIAPLVEKKNEDRTINLMRETLRNDSIGSRLSPQKSLRHRKFHSIDFIEGNYPDQWSSRTLNKPRPREHPQEEELQKFKKEFEAWQAVRMKECSKVIELGSTPSQWLAQDNLNKEKMALYANSMGMAERPEPMDISGSTMTISSHDTTCLQSKEIETDLFPSQEKDPFYSSNTIQNVDVKLSSLGNSGKETDDVSAPSKIVILRPGPDRLCNYEETWPSSPGASEERGSIEDFLEEVKERLKCELQGKSCKRSTTVRGAGIETPYSEKPSDPKQIAQRIAKQVRESVTRDLGMNLFRSESTSSYRSEIQFNGTNSPELISRDTRKFLAERLRNVLKEETHNASVVPGITRPSTENNPRVRTDKLEDVSNTKNKLRYWDRIKDESDMPCRSFRRDANDNAEIHEELSPRNLVRSLSAPVSGTSFGKLLLEDRHMLTGAHIRRKHEAHERITVNVKKQKKEKFNLREKVTSLKYSFTLKGKFFGRKIQSLDERHSNNHDYVRDIIGRPSMMMGYYDRYEEPTEVPPSPASVCSSIHEEFWRPAEYFSPTSISDAASVEDIMTSHIFRDISSNLKELRRQLNELETDVSEDPTMDEQPLDADMPHIEDQAEAYIRDLLVVSGLYDGSYDKSLSRWDPLGKPISNQVFEELEESYKQKLKDDEGEKSNHKMLFDMLNEALPSVLGPPLSMSSFMRKAMGPVAQPPRGRKLLDQLWQIIHVYVHPPVDRLHHFLDVMVTRDLHSSPWSRFMDDDANAVGKDVEYQIFSDLIDELVKDIRYY